MDIFDLKKDYPAKYSVRCYLSL